MSDSRFAALGVASVVGCAVALGLAVRAQAQERPNIIFVLTDDQGIESIQGDYWPNQMHASTPLLSRLAEQGVSFTNCRVNPNCSPTRAALLTGRRALFTGVTGVLGRYPAPGEDPCNDDFIPTGEAARASDLMSLQRYERTIGEVLRDRGYYTILIDKWHVGHNLAGEPDRGLLPTQQGFLEYEDWLDYICLDDPDAIQDEHMVRMESKAIQAVGHADNAGKPFALFYHTVSPHRRWEDSDGRLWWEVDPALTPMTGGLDDQNESRYVQNVEAFDTVLRNLLVTLNVIDPVNEEYNTSSNTVVFFLSDNGTDHLISTFGETHAKSSPYEGGIRVPLIVFGEKISTNPLLAGSADDRLIGVEDFFDTLADVAGASEQERENHVGMVRQGLTFADSIGWRGPTGQQREYTISSLGVEDPEQHEVALVSSDGYKLIAKAGGADLHEMMTLDGVRDRFFDLWNDPEENNELILNGMSSDQLSVYYDMRDRLVDLWPTAVSVSYNPDRLPTYWSEFYDENGNYVLVAYVKLYQLQPPDQDQFYDLAADPDREHNLVLEGMSPEQRAVYDALRADINDLWSQGEDFSPDPDVRVVDIPVGATLVLTDPLSRPGRELTVGHEDVGGSNEREYRGYLWFDVSMFDDLLPSGFTIDDAVRAQIVVGFKQDSQAWEEDPDSYWERDAATGPIRIHKATKQWADSHVSPKQIFDAIDLTEGEELGFVNLPPHIIVDPLPDQQNEQIRTTPMPPRTPVSFGHSDNLLELFKDWYNSTEQNYGVALVATKLTDPEVVPIADQQVQFIRKAILRVTLDRRPQ